MEVNTVLQIDMERPNAIRAIMHGKQGDKLTRKAVLSLCQNGSAWVPDDNLTCWVHYRKPDGTIGVYSEDEAGNSAITISGSTATVTIAQQALTVPGDVNMELMFLSGNTQLTSFCWILRVQESAISGGSESYISPELVATSPQNLSATQQLTARTNIGLGNVPNVTTNNQTPTYTVAAVLSNLVSGEILSLAFGKIAKAVSNLISHLANTNNPHSVTKSQVGLGSADNTSDQDKPVSTAQQAALNLKANADTLTDHTSNTSNPHSVTKAQVGLGNVSNLAPENMPASNEQESEFNLPIGLLLNYARQNAWYIERGTITLTNSMDFPANNSQISVALAESQENTNYIVVTEIGSVLNAGDIDITDKLTNGFKIAFTGSARSVPVKYTVLGGFMR